MRALILATVVLTCVAVTSRGDDDDDRMKLADAFKKMVEGNKKAEAPNKGGIGLLAPGRATASAENFVTIAETPTGKNVKNMVKIWAHLYEPKPGVVNPTVQADYAASYRYVSLASYKWNEGEAYRLCFAPAVSVRVALYNVQNGKPVGEPLFPDPEYAVSRELIPLEKPFEMPITLTTESDAKETISLLFAEKGDPALPKELKPDIGVLKKALNNLRDRAHRNGAAFVGLLANKPPKRISSPNIDDVAIYCTLSQTNTSNGLTGYLQVVFRK